ncbi:hypothetical protein [Mammaliicoccus lentus]|jgi:hypothetical protein|uniref:hypothetical protein n=1 Tax=Mammaliicoccus lentus TaxID=42858 RepID=UPI0035172D77
MMIFDTIKNDICYKTADLKVINKCHIEILFESIHQLLFNIKSNCPFSFMKLFPLIREISIKILYDHLIDIDEKMEELDASLISSMIYKTAEISLLNSSNFSKHKSINTLNSYNFKT